MDILSAILSDPNVIYLMLVVGLWLGITALYIPGTGVAEIVALVLLGGGVVALTGMPTNWWAIMLLVLGVSGFLLVPFVNPAWAQYAEIGLVFQVLGGLLLFDGLSVSPLLIAVSVAVAVLYHRFALLPVMRVQREMPTTEMSIIGATGRVVKTLAPVGTVKVDGELWTARSDDPLEPDTPIIVVAKNGLELTVEKAKREANGRI